MRHLIPLLLLSGTIAFAPSADANVEEKCEVILHTEAIRTLSQDELAAKRDEIKDRYAEAAAEAICESSTSLTYDGFKQQLERANQENLKTGGTDYDTAELYFFLECGEDQVNLSPLAYHAFNLNRDDYGFLGEMTLAIVWKSIGYLDIKDPDYNRSFMDIINRVLTSARKREAITEIEMYQDLLTQIEGFREDYATAVDECRQSGL